MTLLMKEFTLAAHCADTTCTGARRSTSPTLRFLLRFARPLQLFPVFFRLVGVGKPNSAIASANASPEPM